MRATALMWALLGLAAQSDAQVAPRSMATVFLNGARIAHAVSTPRLPERFVVPVAALARAVDGDSAGTSGTARLHVRGNRLIAARTGSCASCPVRVLRTVVISSRLRDVAGGPAIPMDDLVDAFEGRLVVDSSETQLDIHVGKCTWCILEPSPKSSLERSIR